MALDSTMLMLMMNQNSMQNSHQANQMSIILPMLLLGDQKDVKIDENKRMLITMMMQGGNFGDSSSILPLLMLSDETVDFKNLFLFSNILQKDCDLDTDVQFQKMLPLLLMDEKDSNSSDSLMLLLMMQTMGNSPIGKFYLISTDLHCTPLRTW